MNGNTLTMEIFLIEKKINNAFFFKLINYDGWLDPGFWFFFIMSSIMAFLLNYSWMLCTKYNSPLTTTVIGCLKVSYLIFNYLFKKFFFRFLCKVSKTVFWTYFGQKFYIPFRYEWFFQKIAQHRNSHS